MTSREILLRKIATVDFAITDLQIFLNTHPNNTDILDKLALYQDKSDKLKKQFEQQFGPLTPSQNVDHNQWDWISSPWPWENHLKKED
ncbi:MAG: spore coat protein CotJB [Clostridia bacterium]|nr:spore coat protein CotJB [Clostridia bacterium]